MKLFNINKTNGNDVSNIVRRSTKAVCGVMEREVIVNVNK